MSHLNFRVGVEDFAEDKQNLQQPLPKWRSTKIVFLLVVLTSLLIVIIDKSDNDMNHQPLLKKKNQNVVEKRDDGGVVGEIVDEQRNLKADRGDIIVKKRKKALNMGGNAMGGNAMGGSALGGNAMGVNAMGGNMGGNNMVGNNMGGNIGWIKKGLKNKDRRKKKSSGLGKDNRLGIVDQSLPTLYEDKSYVISLDDGDTVVTPMTLTYSYELFSGQLLFTEINRDIIPNFDFDYVVVRIGAVRSINRETNENVSLDEVFLHHMLFNHFGAFSAEHLTRDVSMKLPKGYGIHVTNEVTHVNAHMISNKDLAPIDGSDVLARKHCNECYYGEGKGESCSPNLSGKYTCCGVSVSCTLGALCSCAVTDEGKSATATKYQIQIDMFISRDVNKFKKIETIELYANSCDVMSKFFETDQTSQYCVGIKNEEISLSYYVTEGLYHQIELQEDDDPHVVTSMSYISQKSGKIVYAQGHLHAGAVNATFSINGNTVCSAETTYGTDPNQRTNARNEKNHLIDISPCYDTAIYEDGGVEFSKGDILTSESIYYGGINDDRLSYGAGGEHKNVMSWFFLGVYFYDNEDFELDQFGEEKVIEGLIYNEPNSEEEGVKEVTDSEQVENKWAETITQGSEAGVEDEWNEIREDYYYGETSNDDLDQVEKKKDVLMDHEPNSVLLYLVVLAPFFPIIIYVVIMLKPVWLRDLTKTTAVKKKGESHGIKTQ